MSVVLFNFGAVHGILYRVRVIACKQGSTTPQKGQTTNDNDTFEVPEFAPSLAEADAVLAQFGFVEADALAVA